MSLQTLLFGFVIGVAIFCHPAKGAEGLTSPNKKNSAYVRGNDVLVLIGNKELSIAKINPGNDIVDFVAWTPQGEALIYIIKLKNRVANGPINSYLTGDRWYKEQLFIYTVKSNKYYLLLQTLQSVGDEEYGGVAAFSYKTFGNAKMLCRQKESGCSNRIVMGKGSVTFAINLYYYKSDKELEGTIANFPSETPYGNYYYLSMTFTVDYNGKFLKKSQNFYVYDPLCCKFD